MAVSGTLMAVSMGVNALGAYGQAKTNKANLKYQSEVAANNAVIAQDQATLAEVNGQSQVAQHELSSNAFYGGQRANLAASGVDLGQGSPNDVLTSTKLLSKLDANTIQDNALREAWGFKTQRNNYTAESAQLKANSDAISPTKSAVMSLLGSAQQANNAWNNYAMFTGGQTSGQWMKSFFS
jgi:hypothetical protein